jgi:hypothetical protein
MRRWLALVAGLCLALTIAVPAAARPADPFTGAWKAIDLDGSALTLAISGGGSTRHVVLFDVSCGACDPSGYPTVGVGTGVVISSTLYATLTWHDALGPGTAVGPWDFTAVDGKLRAGDGVLWVRAGG